MLCRMDARKSNDSELKGVEAPAPLPCALSGTTYCSLYLRRIAWAPEADDCGFRASHKPRRVTILIISTD